MELDITRHSGLVDTEKLSNLRVLVIGAGSIGSFTTTALARFGVKNIQVWDKDHLEPHNIPNQDYSIHQDGIIKVKALTTNIFDIAGIRIDGQNGYWEGDVSFKPDIIISGVDSMTSRYSIWNALQENEEAKGIWYLDSRMSSMEMSVFVTRIGNDLTDERYEKYALFPDEEGLQERCTEKTTNYTVLATASHLVRLVSQIINGQKVFTDYHRNSEFFTSSKSDVVVE